MISDNLKEGYRNKIAECYVEFVEKHHKDPTTKEFKVNFGEGAKEQGVTTWKDVFKNITEVREVALLNFADRLKNATFTEEDFGGADYKERVRQELKNYKKFIITTAVNNKQVDVDFLSSIKNYASHNNAAIVIILSHDVRSAKRVFSWNVDPALKCGYVISDDTHLNNNIMIANLTASAKQIHPSSGFSRYCAQLGATIILPGCKQEQTHIAELEPSCRTPHSTLVTGAVTIADYSSDKIIAGRTNWMAEKDHQLGAAIVDLEDEDRFHLRVIQAAVDKSFTDMGTTYRPDGSVDTTHEARYVLGDAHIGGNANDELVGSIIEQIKNSPWITEVLIHDLENATSISHHEENNYLQRVMRLKEGRDDLIGEGNLIVDYINKFLEIPNITLTIVNSNHDRHVERYLNGMKMVFNRDFRNFEPALRMCLAITTREVTCPVQYLVTELTDHKISDPSRVKWLLRDESYKVYGCELGRHGDEGMNGSRGNIRIFQNNLYNAVIAHSHSAAIKHKVFQVGMTGSLNQDYNHGLSSWTHTNCLVYEDGTKQLIDFIPTADGGYTYSA